MSANRDSLRRETAPPSGIYLEKALLAYLRRSHFAGAEKVSVFVVGLDPMPIYLLNVGADVAEALSGLLTTVLGRRPQPSATEWVLFRADVDAILGALV